MNEEERLSAEPQKEVLTVNTKSLTIKVASAGKEILADNVPSTPDSLSKNSLTNSVASSPWPFWIQIQIQPKRVPPGKLHVLNHLHQHHTVVPSPDDIPSTSYTPPPERRDYSDDPANTNLKIVTCVPVSGPDTAPRVSFSFPVPRMSFAKASVSPISNSKLRSFDVYIGFHGQNPNLIRFCKWLKLELEVQGIACFVADRANYVDNQSHEIADKVICSVTFAVVVVTKYSLLNHLSLEELRFFAQKKNLIPVFFET
ncbi:P-loop containing nucleoside triphosphate hydrolase superfamily protein [Abeliophyllum distichum]|uniref:P-loop containing nucleoside triphosphate hydrolase superfamily protein n=1 Tax=Abeliophyllum distichum TaxID=126358 RepID=A0ABD1PUE3_9LAMI